MIISLSCVRWRLAQRCADDAWDDIGACVRGYEAGQGDPPTEDQIARAVRLEHEAVIWMMALQKELNLPRQAHANSGHDRPLTPDEARAVASKSFLAPEASADTRR